MPTQEKKPKQPEPKQPSPTPTKEPLPPKKKGELPPDIAEPVQGPSTERGTREGTTRKTGDGKS